MQLSIICNRDTVLNQALPTTNVGTSGSLGIAGKDATTAAGFMAYGFSLAGLAATDRIDNATLYLTQNATNATGREYYLYRLLSANAGWTETGATWNTRDGSTAWAGGTTGGGLAGTDIAAMPVGQLSWPPSGVLDTVYAIPVDVAAITAAIADGSISLIMKREGATTSASPSFRMTQTGTSAQKPVLVINYQPRTAIEVGVTGYFCAPTGNDTTGDGSYSTPWSTPTKLFNTTPRGGRGFMRGGDYVATNFNPDLRLITGTTPIIHSSYPTERATIIGTLYIANASYVEFQDFDVIWNANEFPVGTASWVHMMKMRGGLSWVLRRVKIHEAIAHSGLCIDLSPSNTGTLPGDLWSIEDCDIFNTYRPSYSTNNQDHNLYIATRAPTQAYVRRNRFWYTRNGQNIKIGSDTEDTGRITLSYNSIYDANGTDVKNISLSHKCLGCTVEYNILHSPIPTNYNVEQTSANGVLGTDYGSHIVRNNIGYGGVGVAEVLAGLTDGGGNQVLDPAFLNPDGGVFLPNPAGASYATVKNYGTFAPQARIAAVTRTARV